MPRTNTHTLIITFMFLACAALFITGVVHRNSAKTTLEQAKATEWPFAQPDTTLTFSKDGHVQSKHIPAGENIELITDKDGYLLDVRIISTSLGNGDLGGVDPKAYSKGVKVSE